MFSGGWHVFSGKLIVPWGNACVHSGNDHLPQETTNFLVKSYHSSRKMPISLEEQQVPQGKCTCFLGSNKFPGEDECIPWETRANPPRTCYSLWNKCNSLGNLLFPKKEVHFSQGTFCSLGNTCNPLGTYCSLWKMCIYFPERTCCFLAKKRK